MELDASQFSIPQEGIKVINDFIYRYDIKAQVKIDDELYIVTTNNYTTPGVPVCEHINEDNALAQTLGMLSTWVTSVYFYGYSYVDWARYHGGDNEESLNTFGSYMLANRHMLVLVCRGNIDMYSDFIRCGMIIHKAWANLMKIEDV